MLCFVVCVCSPIFSELRDTGNKYKMRVRSRFSNLGDVKNPELKRRVITGMITPDRIATMTTDVRALINLIFTGVPHTLAKLN